MMKTTGTWLRRAAMSVLAAAALVTAGPAAAESNGGVRVMPLGDSITDGWRIDQIDANIVNWLRTYTPRTVLLHIGTNDVLQNYDLAGAPGRLSTLVDHITATAPDTEVFVATIIPLANAGQEANARAFNATIPAMVASKANAGKHVHLVDMHSALTTADLIDGIHPTATGYDKMAATWYAALRSVPGSLTTPGRQVVGTQSGRCADVVGVATANGTQVQLYDCNGQANQSWTVTTGGQLTVYGTKCLAEAGQGAPVTIWDCTGQTDQQWSVNTNGTITSARSGLCLDANGRGTANGTRLILWPCNGQANQQWTLR